MLSFELGFDGFSYDNIIEEQDFILCCVGYDEVEELLIIERNGVHFELNCNEIEDVDIEDEKDTVITLAFTDGTAIVIRPLNKLEVRRQYAEELLIHRYLFRCYNMARRTDLDILVISLNTIKTAGNYIQFKGCSKLKILTCTLNQKMVNLVIDILHN